MHAEVYVFKNDFDVGYSGKIPRGFHFERLNRERRKLIMTLCKLKAMYHIEDNGKFPFGFHSEKVKAERIEGREATNTKESKIRYPWQLCALRNMYHIDDSGKIILRNIYYSAFILEN